MKKNKVKLKGKINKNHSKKKMILLMVGVIIILCCVGIASYYAYININGESKYLRIKLKGDREITLDYGSEYKDLGANAYYKNKNISKDIKIVSNIDLNKIGSYTYNYSIKYKKQSKSVIRKINIVDTKAPEISLNGKAEVSLYVGDNYKEENANATDNYDGDITDKISISGEVDTSKVGEYVITYNILDSSNNEASIERKIKVIEKPKAVQKIAVLNYHFFYEDWNSEPCHESICEKMDTFRKQLQYLNDNGFKTLTMKEFVDWMYGKIDVPEKSVLITIDDGAYGTGKHNGNHLIPALEQYKVNATLFLITGWWDISNYQSPYLEVESHTHDLHIEESSGYRSKVNHVGYDRLMEDLKQSIEVTKSTNAFCFPFYESSSESIRAVKDSGFKVAFVGGNRKASRNDDKFRIPRYPIQNSTSMEQFKNMVN